MAPFQCPKCLKHTMSYDQRAGAYCCLMTDCRWFYVGPEKLGKRFLRAWLAAAFPDERGDNPVLVAIDLLARKLKAA